MARRCPKGTIKRKAFRNRRGVKYSAKCICDRGLPGTFKQRFPGVKGIGTLKKGTLSQHGYRVSGSDAARHRALDKAVDDYGALSVFRKLKAVATYSHHTSPANFEIFNKDAEYVHDKYVYTFGSTGLFRN